MTDLAGTRDWTRTFVRPDATLREVLATIDAATLQVALVVDEATRLLGIITDGDVRRALLRGVDLSALAEEVMTHRPVTASPDLKPAAIQRLMWANDLHQVPVIDANGVLVGLALHGTLLPRERLDRDVFLMAGGLGTRLGALTKRVPKPMLRIGDKPILELILDDLLAQGFHRFSIAVNYRAELIERHFGDGGRWGADVRYLRETKRLGTCGALSLIADRPTESFLVINGDILAKLSYQEMLDAHEATGAAATLAVRDYAVQVPFGVARMDGDGRVRELSEKPTERFAVNGGIYVLDPACLDLIPEDTPFDMTQLLDDLLARGLRVQGHRINDYWVDVGRASDLAQADADFEANWREEAAERT